jgi:two-component sensor histidine kinase
MGNDRDDFVVQFKYSLISRIMIITSVIGTAAAAASVWLSLREHLYLLAVVDLLALLVFCCLAFIKRIPYPVKVYATIALCFLLSAFLFVYTGPHGAGYIYLFAGIIMTSLFRSLQETILANILAVLLLFANYLLLRTRHLGWDYNPLALVITGVNFFTIAVFVSVGGVFLVRGLEKYIRTSTVLRNQLQKELEIKDVLIREIEHRVKNNLQVISSLVNIRARNSDDPARTLNEIQNSIQALSVVHQLLYRRESSQSLSLALLVGELLKRFADAWPHIRFEKDLEADTECSNDNAVVLGLIVNELVMNAVKHAFGGGGEPVIRLRTVLDGKTGQFSIEIGDNGSGIPLSVEGDSGSGHKILTALARQIPARLETGRDNGTMVTVSFQV